MADALNCDDFFTQNTDISGIGVRLALYLQVILLRVQTALAPEEAVNAFWTLAAMTLGLIVAAIISAAQNQLSFYNANIVQNLTWLVNNYLMIVYLSLREHKLQKALLTVVFFVEITLSEALTIYLWAAAYHFGPDAQCTPTLKFYILFWKLPLSFKAIRIIALLIYSADSLNMQRRIRSHQEIYAQLRALEAMPVRNPNDLTPRQVSKIAQLGGAFAGLLASCIVLVPPIELFLKQHPEPSDSDGQWSFGQILALIAVMPLVVSVVFGFREAFGKPPRRRDEMRRMEATLPRLRDRERRGAAGQATEAQVVQEAEEGNERETEEVNAQEADEGNERKDGEETESEIKEIDESNEQEDGEETQPEKKIDEGNEQEDGEETEPETKKIDVESKMEEEQGDRDPEGARLDSVGS